MSPAVLEELVELSPSVRVERGAPAPPPSFREIGCGYRSGRSLGFSVILHQIVLLAVVFFPSHYILVRSVEAVPPRLDRVVPIDKTLYLPTLGGGSEGAGKTGGGAGSEEELSSGVRARSQRGFAYPGPQPMVSNPPRATLGIQTILQPSLKNPPLLRRFMPLPNIAQPTEVAVADPPKSVIKVQAGTLAIRPSVQKPIRAPKITLPVTAASQGPTLDAPEPIVPQLLPPKPPVPAPVPAPAEISDVPMDRSGQKGLLVLNAVPPPPDVPKNIPAAEARSLFAVTPGEATVIADPGAGSKSGILPSMAAGIGTPADVASGDALAEAAAGGSSKNSSGSGSGNGGRYGSGKGSGLNPAEKGTGLSRGTMAGAGTGSGAGTTLGSGKGAGSAAGTGGFPGITISGGRYGNGDATGLHASLTPHRQTSYAMNITSTASSGGGLPDLGVFNNEKVYTVYLDMKADDEDPAPTWILQYAVLQPPSNPAGTSTRIQGTPTPPYAILKQIPEFAPDVLRKYAHKLIFARAIMAAAGNLEQITLPQNSDTQLASLLVEALGHWMFQPAQIDGKPVPLKILLGIRLAPSR